MKNKPKTRYCGRDFTPEEFEALRRLIAKHPDYHRAQLAKLVCKELNWYKLDGDIKIMSCKVAMIRMHEDGLLTLPTPRHPQYNRCPKPRITQVTDPCFSIEGSVGELSDLRLEPISNKKQSVLWNEFIHRYHYLGYTPLPGAQLRYMALSRGQILALLGFGAAAWKIAPRDNYIGWSEKQRQKNLHLIVNNIRFLILPWIKVKNLASKLLAMASKRLSEDWQHRYKYQPVLLETFVECGRFHGTCYKAANWIHVGQTRGRGKKDIKNTASLPKKDIWLYPLNPSFIQLLTN